MGGIMDLLMIAVVIGGGIYVIKNVLPGLMPAAGGGDTSSTDTTNVTNVTNCSPTCVNQGNQICCSANDAAGGPHTGCALNQADAANRVCQLVNSIAAIAPGGGGKSGGPGGDCVNKGNQMCASGVAVNGQSFTKCAKSCKTAKKYVDQLISQNGGYAGGTQSIFQSRPGKKNCKHGKKCNDVGVPVYTQQGKYIGHDQRYIGKTQLQIGQETASKVAPTSSWGYGCPTCTF